MGSAWKVAYADFVTALMAFFLMMWVLNMTPPETKVGLAAYFLEEATLQSSSSSAVANSAMVNRPDKLDLRDTPMSEMEKSNYAIMQKIKTMLSADVVPQNATGLSADDVGVLLRVNNDAMFTRGSSELTEAGKNVLEGVVSILHEYNVYVVVSGHADPLEASTSQYPSAWELSAARAAAAVRYLESREVKSTRMRALAYSDTRPLAPGQSEESLKRNRRVEFHFHRPEAKSSSVDL